MNTVKNVIYIFKQQRKNSVKKSHHQL